MARPQETHQRSDGLNYAPRSAGVVHRVCGPGEFPFAAVRLDHGHIHGMTTGLEEAGGELRWVWDPDPAKIADFLEKHPGAPVADTFEQILADPAVKLVASAAVANERWRVGLRVLSAGKDYFCDKPLFTELEQIARARSAVAETGRKYMGYFSERLHVECAVKAGELIGEGRIGRVLQVIGLGPHRISIPSRPDWFFDPVRYGGILCDLGSHQIEQFLHYAGARDAKVVNSQIANYRHKEYPGFQDFGDMNLVADNGATGYFRMDWFTPDALDVWGDGRTFILGTDGYIELRKYIDAGASADSDLLVLVNNTENEAMRLRGRVGFPFFGELILDCLNRTEAAMTQEHVFKTSELAIIAQKRARTVE